MRNRLFQEDHVRDCQEIEELRRICCEETDRARQARIDELSLRPERNPTTVSQLMAQIRELQNKINSLEGLSSTILNSSKNLASSSQGLRPGIKGNRKETKERE